MPLYIYQHPQSLEIKEVFQKMNDKHEFFDEAGLEWRRVYVSPNAFIGSSSKINPFNSKDFVKFTGEKKGTYGEMASLSAELSSQRIAKEGRDTVKENFFAAYQKDTGKKHFNDKKSVVEKNGFKVLLEKD